MPLWLLLKPNGFTSLLIWLVTNFHPWIHINEFQARRIFLAIWWVYLGFLDSHKRIAIDRHFGSSVPLRWDTVIPRHNTRDWKSLDDGFQVKVKMVLYDNAAIGTPWSFDIGIRIYKKNVVYVRSIERLCETLMLGTRPRKGKDNHFHPYRRTESHACVREVFLHPYSPEDVGRLERCRSARASTRNRNILQRHQQRLALW